MCFISLTASLVLTAETPKYQFNIFKFSLINILNDLKALIYAEWMLFTSRAAYENEWIPLFFKCSTIGSNPAEYKRSSS
ncbi:Uncharacterised protein [Mycobacteroides abscessus subsp. massiliense]|nr:Uncharacterised protein [Mycobacteroides abscessus subsp. massiliense]